MSLPTFIMPQPNDASVGYLASILGHGVVNGVMGLGAPGYGMYESHVFARMMDVFNHLLLGGGLIIFAILLFVGTMNTAADGQFLGRNMHSVWTPMRLIFGILLVVPLKTGYCIGQYIILYAIFIGIHLATSLWQHAINDVFNNQDSAPPPTYLTTEVQQVLSEALNSLAVPVVMKDANIAPSGSGNNGIIEIEVNDQYSIASGNLPTDLQQSIMNNVTGTGNNEGVCAYLYSGLIGNCGTAVAGALGNSSNNGQPQNIAGDYYVVSIGSNLPSFSPTDDYSLGMPASPWPNPDGIVNVYGYYIYDPANLFPSTGGNGGGSGGSNSPNCVTDPTQPGCQTYVDVQNVFTNAVVTPVSNYNNDPKDHPLSSLANICSTTISVTPPNSKNTVQMSPCDLRFPIQDIMNQAKQYAQATAVCYATGGTNCGAAINTPNANQPGQAPLQSAGGNDKGSPTPFPYPANFVPGQVSGEPPYFNPNDPYQVPPDGQAAAAADNMYVYKDSTGQLHVGYNLNDYWIPDINSQTYIDLQLNNSWWVAGSAYLVLDNALGQNLAWMAEAIQTELQQFQMIVTNSTTNPNLSYQCGTSMSSGYSPDTNPNDLTSFITPEFCVSYGMQIMEYTASPNLQVDSVRNNTFFYQPDTEQSNNVYDPGLCEIYNQSTVPGNNNTIDYYSCAQDLVRASQPIAYSAKYNLSNVAVPNWINLIAPYDPSGSSSPHIDISATPALYEELLGMPANLQGPLAVLLTAAQAQGAQGYQNLYPYLVTLIALLQYNGALSGNEIESSLPVNNSINKIFDQLIGGHNGVGGSGEMVVASSVNTIMQQVYDLGTTANYSSNGMIASQFSLIQQAQTAGISMIMACVTSMQAIYDTYTAALQGLIDRVNSMGNAALPMLQTLGYMGALPVIGSIFTTQNATQLQLLQLAMTTTTVTSLTSIAIQLMWLPLLLFILTSLFTAGVQFAILVPLMPYILFWAGQLAWLIGVIEAVVAAPLVMLGLAHPGGNEILGHAQPAVRMLIGVMFRPVLMVIGLIVGILLTYIVINFSAQGFHTVAAGILNAVPQSEANVQGIMACLMLFIYATFLVMAFQKCFSTIYTIPEKVVEWIGGQAAKAGPEELQQISSATQQTAQSAGQAGGQTLNAGIDAQKQSAQQRSDLAQKSVSTQSEVAQSYGKSTNEVGMAALKLMA